MIDRAKFAEEMKSGASYTEKERKAMLAVISEYLAARPFEENCAVPMEELAELIQEISRQLRGKGDKLGLIEEMADVYIVLELIKPLFGISGDDVRKAVDVKLKRQIGRIGDR